MKFAVSRLKRTETRRNRYVGEKDYYSSLCLQYDMPANIDVKTFIIRYLVSFFIYFSFVYLVQTSSTYK